MRKKNKRSLLIVDLSTSSRTAGARIIPLVDYFVKSGYQVYLLINQATKKHYFELFGSLAKKITVETFPFSKNFPGGKFLLGLEYLKRVIISPFVRINKKINVIYSLTGIICDVFPSFIFKLRTKKIWVANIDNIEAPPSQKPGSYLVNLFSFLGFRFSLFFLRWADLVFVTTPLKEVETTLIKGGISPEKIVLSNNGIPFDYIQKIKEPQKPVYSAIFMGRIHQGKGVFDLVKIWKKVVRKISSVGRLVFLGTGDKETITKLKNLIRKNKLTTKITLAGFMEGKAKYQILKSSQVFLYPSYYDANPISTVEALACGLPVVVYDLPIFIEHYPRDIIEIVPKGDINKFSEKAFALLNDPKKRRAMAERGKKWAKGFNWEEIFRKQEKIITRLLKKKCPEK